MDFELTEEQKMFQSMIRDFVNNEVAPHAAAWDELSSLFATTTWRPNCWA